MGLMTHEKKILVLNAPTDPEGIEFSSFFFCFFVILAQLRLKEPNNLDMRKQTKKIQKKRV